MERYVVTFTSVGGLTRHIIFDRVNRVYFDCDSGDKRLIMEEGLDPVEDMDLHPHEDDPSRYYD